MCKLKIIFIISILFSTTLLKAQRPKVGLVLSGGGAKGISHIGILEAIDSAGLKIDYVTGTSMGSVIGSLYSVGYSGKQIEDIANKLNWDVLLSNKANYNYISIDEKDEYGNYSAEIGIKDKKPQIGTGLIESEELWLTFNELFLPVHNIKDFSKFSIPFKCISTDLSTGKAVVHSDGEIVTAVRASMAIPSVFTAVNADTTKLVDGGIIRNFPVTDIKKMGADYVIGVNLFLGLPDVSKLNNALDVFYQITQYRDADDLVHEKKLCDLIIEPPVENYSAGSFGASKDIMNIGKDMGNKYYPYFKRLADSLNKLYPIDYSPHNRLPKVDTIVIDEIDVVGIKHTSKDLLLDKIGVKVGKYYTADQINQGCKKAYSSQYYDNVYYELTPADHGHVKVKFIIRESLLTQAKVGLSYHSYTGFALIGNLTVRDLFFLKKSRTYVKVAVGDYFRIYAEHRQAFGRRANNYFNLSYFKENLPYNIYNGGDIKSLYNVKYTEFDANLTKVVGNDWSITAGACINEYKFKPKVAGEERVDGKTNSMRSYLRTEAKTINRRNFPTRGYDFIAEAGVVFNRTADMIAYSNDSTSQDISSYVHNKPEFYKFQSSFTKYNTLSDKMTLYYNLQAGLTLNSQNFLFDNYFIGGVQPIFKQQLTFVGVNEGQINSSSTGALMLGLQYNLVKELFLIGRANTGLYNFTNNLNLYDTDKVKWINGFSAGFGYNLSVLPIEYNLMYSPEIGSFYSNIKIGFIF